MNSIDVLKTIDKINARCRKEMEEIILRYEKKSITVEELEAMDVLDLEHIADIARELGENSSVVEHFYFAWVKATKLILLKNLLQHALSPLLEQLKVIDLNLSAS